MIKKIKSLFSGFQKDNIIRLSVKNLDDLKYFNTAKQIFICFQNQNYKLKLVGGCVRKLITEEKIDDMDIAINIEPEKIKKVLVEQKIKFVETGITHGTITVLINDFKFEITSLRKDLSTDGRHAKVEFTSNWEQDAQRRDFTINAIFSDIHGNLYDPFDGKKDLEIGKIKFIGDADKRIKEDYLRILRYIRFFLNYSKISHNEKIRKIIKQNLNGISNISSERLLDEFKKLINSFGFLRLFKDPFCLELINLIFPQFKNLDIFKNLNKFAEINIKKVDFVFLISLMLIDNTDNVEYFLFKFNLSSIDKKRILFLNKFYNKEINKNSFSKNNLWKIFYYNGKQTLFDLIYFEIFKSKKINKKLIALLEYFKNKETPVFPVKAVNLMEKYNIPEGKQLGLKLKKIEELWIKNDFTVLDNEIEQIFKN